MSTINERYIERIDAALPLIPKDSTDRAPLEYIKSQLTPERLKWRAEHDMGGDGDPATSHLHAVADQRLRIYEKETSS